MTVPVLHYFSGMRARGDAVRLALLLGGKKYKEHGFTISEWVETERRKSPTLKCPYLTLPNGHTVPETLGCMVWAGHEKLLPGDNAEQLARVYALITAADAVYQSRTPLYRVADPAEKERMWPPTKANVDAALRAVESIVGLGCEEGNNKKIQWAAGTPDITIADIYIYTLIEATINWRSRPYPEVLEGLPRLSALYDFIGNDKRIKDALAGIHVAN